ncbi:MAG: hypothetical protein GEV07_15155 [Streptosporangiales bacterium]|nr:hypothetical protein [Streptosporangiales bacterium]
MIATYSVAATVALVGSLFLGISAATSTAAKEPTATPTSKPAKAASSKPVDEPTEQPEDIEYAMGDVARFESDDGTRGKLKVSGPRLEDGAAYSYASTPANGHFVIFKMRPSCQSGSYQVWAEDFYVVTRGGERFDMDDGNAWDATSQEQISVETVNAGERKKGVLAFDLPSVHGKMYEPNGDGEPIATWAF